MIPWAAFILHEAETWLVEHPIFHALQHHLQRWVLPASLNAALVGHDPFNVVAGLMSA